MTENSLVATAESPGGLTTGMGDPAKGELDNLNAQTGGAGIFSDAASTLTDARNGDWGNLAMDVGTDALDLLGAAMDPLGTLASAGVGWLIEHISFLKDGLDKLAGKPEAITAKAVTWTNIAKQLNETAESYEQKAKKVQESFSDCGSAEAYQRTAESYVGVLRGAASHAEGASTAMNIGAALVGTERGLIRDMISSFVGELIIKALAALAASWCTFGGTIAAFIADTVVEGGVLAEKISTRITKVVEKLESLAKGAGKSKAALEGAANALKKAGKSVDKIVDKSVDTAAKIEQKANELKQAGKEAKSAEETAKGWSDAAESHVPGREKVEGLGDKYSEDGRSALKPAEWQKAGGYPGWSTADTVGVVTEGRRQENEQIDRYHEGREAYEKEHPEGGAE
ncbi:PPE domain-containing protein [Amycolatopsis sp. NPDC004378]